MLEFLLSPIDPARVHDVGMLISWHGRFMVFAWGVLLPLGVLAARFCKALPGQDWPREIQNPFWFTWHRVFQNAGLVSMSLALVAILLHAQVSPRIRLHQWFGWSVVSLTALQVVAAMVKGGGGGPAHNGPGNPGGDHFLMSRKRVLFEVTHKALGYLLLLVSVVGIVTGMWIANAVVWMWLAQIGLWIGFMAAFVILQRRGWAIDTYQAIWGTDPTFIGNQRPPIGWGIRRGAPMPHEETINVKKRRAAEKSRETKRH